MERKIKILNLGAGVQSSTIHLMMADGEMEPADYSIFADTGEEEKATYQHLEWLKSQGGPEIICVSLAGTRLGDDLIKGINSTGQRFASIPAFVSSTPGKTEGMVRRQCTNEYKIQPIELYIRRTILGLEKHKKAPKDVTVQYFGFSVDEPGRAARTKNRFRQVRWGTVDFPLWWEDFQMTRQDCINYLNERCPHPVHGSVCTFCPYRSNRMWRDLKKRDPKGWQRAVEVDKRMREEDARCNQQMDKRLYVHRSCRPLDEANLEDQQLDLFDMECEGGCGL